MNRLMRHLAIGLLLFPVLLAWSNGHTAAHELAQNNGVNAVLQIGPDDNPVAAKPTKLKFEFSNLTGSFTLKDYATTVELIANNQTVHRYVIEPTPAGSASVGSATVTFPTGAVYEVMLTGVPSAAGVPKFTIMYPVRVTGPTTTQRASASLQAISISVASLGLLALIATRNIRAGQKYRPKKVENKLS